jgi:hypothetical protein
LSILETHGSSPLARLVLVTGAGLCGCTAINDADDFVIEPPMAYTPSLTPPEDDCRRSNRSSQCNGSMPQRCSATGVWEDVGVGCELGCADGVCYECTPGASVCSDAERLRRQCSESGRWMNAEPCALDSPYCINGGCIACLPGQRTCIDGLPQTCGSDGHWRAEQACPMGQSCVPETGECRACALGEVRTCRDAIGNCAAGVVTCQPDGSWSPCNITPREDACEPLGDDGDCNGIPNSPATACVGACTLDFACGPLANVGVCRTGVSSCSEGVPGRCEGAIWQKARDCRSLDDNDCNGVPDYLDDTCTCDATDPEPKPCPNSVYADDGICERQVRSCLVAPGGTRSYWGQCWGGAGPQLRNCSSADDNDCDGTPDDQSPACACSPGAGRLCTVAGCDGVQRCLVSPNRDATSWGECELSSDWVFAEPERIVGLGVMGDVWGPALSPDASRLLFSGGAPEHIYIADSLGGSQFGAAGLVTELNGATTEGTPFVAASGQAIYFDSRRRAGAGRDIWRAPATAAGWGPAELVPNVNSTANDQNPWLSPDERLMVFNSDRGGDIDLFAAVWSAGAFGAPFSLDELNSNASDEGATLTRDGLTVFFASNRQGGSGGLDIWLAARESVESAFSIPQNLGGINSAADELDLALAPDGQALFFSSSRGGAYQLYRAERGCTPSASAQVERGAE